MAAALLVSLGLWPAVSQAQSLQITPSMAVSETFTNNVGQAAVGQASDAYTRVDLGLGLRSRHGVVQGFFDYSLTGLAFARQSERNGHQQQLSARGDVEWYERRGFLEVSASIGQAALSAFSVQPGINGLANANSTEVRNLRVAPSWRGRFGPELEYSIKAEYGLSSTQDSRIGDGHTTGLSMHLGSDAATRLGWSLDASHSQAAYGAGRSTQSDRLLGGGSMLLPELDLRLSASAGMERSNLSSADGSSATWGLGAIWSPTPRTQLSAQFEDRPFGNTHTLSLQHRTPLTVWTLSDTTALSTSGNQLGSASSATLYDLFYAQFASVEPDPIKRADLVNSYLRSYGLDPGAGVRSGLLSSAASVLHNTSLSVAARGTRSTATLSLSRSVTRRADTLSTGVDELSASPRIVSKNIALNLAHQLTPRSNLNLALSWLDSQGSQAAQSLQQRSAQLQYSDQWSKDLNLSLALRRTLYKTALLPFSESAVVLSAGLRF